jgi:hypothetical protein
VTDYTDLVRRLRQDQVNLTGEEMDDAADAIERLQADLATAFAALVGLRLEPWQAAALAKIGQTRPKRHHLT